VPFKSQQQRKFMYSQHPKMAKEWERETPAGKLPRKVGEDVAMPVGFDELVRRYAREAIGAGRSREDVEELFRRFQEEAERLARGRRPSPKVESAVWGRVLEELDDDGSDEDAGAMDRIRGMRAPRPYVPEPEKKSPATLDRLAQIKGRAERPDQPTGPLRMANQRPETVAANVVRAAPDGLNAMEIMRGMWQQMKPGQEWNMQHFRQMLAARKLDLPRFLDQSFERGPDGKYRSRG